MTFGTCSVAQPERIGQVHQTRSQEATQGLGVFVQDLEPPSFSDLEDVEEEWKKLDPTSDILAMVNSKEFIGERPVSAPPMSNLPVLGKEAESGIEGQLGYQDFDYYSSYGYGTHQVSDGQGMYGSFMWQTVQGYPYFDQWQAATSSFISAFGGYYDFVPKSGKKGRGRDGDPKLLD
eukprot:symbB.v1.2.012227.t1/scaffold808.1/size182989/4